MTTNPAINLKSLREQVYDHLKAEFRRGTLEQGAFLDLKRLAQELGVSRTPLRDALLQFEVEEFVTIAPRRGVAVRILGPRDIQEIYQLVGSLEATAILAAAPGLAAEDYAQLRELDQESLKAVEREDVQGFFDLNDAFHDFFLNRLGNRRISDLVRLKKHQLYDWNRKFEHLHTGWEHSGIREHEDVIRLLEGGQAQEAAAHWRDVHWGFTVQEPFVNQVYFSE